MLIRTFYFEPASIIGAVVCSLTVAGLLKGTIGVGMPVVALPLLSLFINVKSAAMLLSMPLIFSNLPQALEGGKTGRDAHQWTWTEPALSALDHKLPAILVRHVDQPPRSSGNVINVKRIHIPPI